MFKRWGMIILAIICIGISAGCRTNAQKASAASSIIGDAIKFVQSTASGKFNDATAQFDDVMRQAMSAEQLKQAWQALTGQCGAFKQISGTRTQQMAGFDIVFVACQFEKTMLDAKVVFNQDGKISGLWFVPHVSADEAQYKPPVYSNKSSFGEQKVTVGDGEWKLPGILTVPKGDGPFPAVVLVHGSGPNDRDETIGPNKPFYDLASGLASHGIAVLRYDKRTLVYPKWAASADKMTVKDEVIDDVLAAVKLLRTSKQIDSKRIYVLGHSLGGMLIPRIGKADSTIAGLIVMAGPTRPLEDIILDQITSLSQDSSPSAEAKKRIDEVRRQVALVKNLKSSASSRILGAPAAYWLDLRDYHPAEAAKSLKQPMLILQGGRDYQVTKVEYEGWQKALSDQPNVTLKLHPSLNHLFIDGTGKSTPQEYEKHGQVYQPVIDDISAWIKAH